MQQTVPKHLLHAKCYSNSGDVALTFYDAYRSCLSYVWKFTLTLNGTKPEVPRRKG